jgi:hypothetical protein
VLKPASSTQVPSERPASGFPPFRRCSAVHVSSACAGTDAEEAEPRREPGARRAQGAQHERPIEFAHPTRFGAPPSTAITTAINEIPKPPEDTHGVKGRAVSANPAISRRLARRATELGLPRRQASSTHLNREAGDFLGELVELLLMTCTVAEERTRRARGCAALSPSLFAPIRERPV